MSRYLYGKSVAAFTESRAYSWRAFLDGALDTLRIWLKRHRERTELLHYMAIDHRAASDIGTARDARGTGPNGRSGRARTLSWLVARLIEHFRLSPAVFAARSPVGRSSQQRAAPRRPPAR